MGYRGAVLGVLPVLLHGLAHDGPDLLLHIALDQPFAPAVLHPRHCGVHGLLGCFVVLQDDEGVVVEGRLVGQVQRLVAQGQAGVDPDRVATAASGTDVLCVLVVAHVSSSARTGSAPLAQATAPGPRLCDDYSSAPNARSLMHEKANFTPSVTHRTFSPQLPFSNRQ
ncbi:hypothetical protein [Streptomyces sp. NPDC048224]|uniref:hypothetical protein n=1 Tax=Streptomyces sp. NPDC048224 TaxID=3154500 RepID=UPI0033F5D216